MRSTFPLCLLYRQPPPAGRAELLALRDYLAALAVADPLNA